MCTDRRDFLRLSAGIAGATLFGSSLADAQQGGSQPEAIRRLRRMTDNVVPITMDERARIDKAQKQMREQRIDAIYIETGQQHVLLHGHALGYE
jgi:methylphosphotriester-DNA--protein-cysteine methyltransferase